MLTLPAVLMLLIDILLSAEGAPVFSCESNNDGVSNSKQQRVNSKQ
jgi:hypothetical protein